MSKTVRWGPPRNVAIRTFNVRGDRSQICLGDLALYAAPSGGYRLVQVESAVSRGSKYGYTIRAQDVDVNGNMVFMRVKPSELFVPGKPKKANIPGTYWFESHAGYWPLLQAKLEQKDDESRWVVDTQTDEMLRVVTAYDDWIFSLDAYRSALGDTKSRYRIVDGVAWMTEECREARA